MERMAQRVVAEGLSVRAVEEIVTVGDGKRPARTRKARGARVTPVEVVDLVGRLSERLDTRVSADAGSGKGRVTIEYASVDDLRRIVEIIDGDGA
jgi:ParB family chromosome partitioning protein